MVRIRYLAGFAGLLFFAGCSLVDENAGVTPTGLVVGDEPDAVRAGAQVLADGGSAADAAAATYFALAVTYPVAAGLGGGGLCIVHDSRRGANEEIDYLPRDTARPGTYAVPGAVAGIALLQSIYGKLPWPRVVSTSEGFAAAGFRMTHALASRLSENKDIIRLDAGLAAEFLDESGQIKPEGSIVANPALAQALAGIRRWGAAGLYKGGVAQEIAEYSAAQGGAITISELGAYAPTRNEPAARTIGSQIVFFPSSNVGAGQFILAMLSRLTDAQGGVRGGDNVAASVAEATKATLVDFHLASLPRDLGATAFAATDEYGQAVACAVTMNGPFGSGRTAPGTGITLARAPSAGKAGLAAAFLTPAIAQNSAGLSLVGAGAGGPNGTAALVYAILKVSLGVDITQPGQLHSTGIAPYDTVNTIACAQGICAAIPDPGASGLGAAGKHGS